MTGTYRGEVLTLYSYIRILESHSFKRGEWRDRALCKDLDPDLFFPDKGTSEYAKEVIAVCKECPVRLECLSYGLQVSASSGVWGGVTPKKRWRIKRKLNAAIKAMEHEGR